jgi:hypothetical protein
MLGVFLLWLYWVGSIMPYILFVKCFRMTVIGNFGVRAGDQATAWSDKHRPEKIEVQVVSCNVLIAILSSSTPRCWLPLLIWLIQWLQEPVQLSHIVTWAEVHRFFKSLRSYLKILGTKRVTGSKFCAKDPQILVANVQNLFVVATASWRQGFVHPWARARGGRPRIRGSVPDRGRVYLLSISSRPARKPTGPPNHWRSTSASLFTFVAWCLIKLADKFICRSKVLRFACIQNNGQNHCIAYCNLRSVEDGNSFP